MNTSLSEGAAGYSYFCQKASVDDEVFKSFRNEQIYKKIVETVSQRLGKEYLKIILSQSPELAASFDEFRKNDKYGEPALFDCGVYGKFSPTTLRYIKVLSDLKYFFGDIKKFKIIEIGGGYGGLCRIISSYYNLDSYDIVDIEPALKLTKKYLSKFDVKNVNFLTLDELDAFKKYDLVISNYALSECRRKVQQHYFDKVIKNSSRGYITWNFIRCFAGYKDIFTLRELSEKVENSIIIASNPERFSTSRILIWGNTRKFSFYDLLRFNLPARIKNIQLLFLFFRRMKNYVIRLCKTKQA